MVGRFGGRDAVLEIIQPGVQPAYPLEYQRAFRGRVALTLLGSGSLIAGRIWWGRVVLFASSRHSP